MSPRLRPLARLTNAQARSLVKRINERIADVGRTFGKNSEVYRDTIAPLALNEEFAPYLTESKSGYLKIKMDLRSQKWKDSGLLNTVKTAEGSVQSVGQLKANAEHIIIMDKRREWEAVETTPFDENYRPSASEIYEEMEETKKYENDMLSHKSFMYDVHTDEENREIYKEMYGKRGRRLTRQELDAIFAREKAEKNAWIKRMAKKEEKNKWYLRSLQ